MALRTGTNQNPDVLITITGPDGEHEEIHVPARRSMTLAQRIRWRVECWQVDARNVLFWLRGGL